MDYAAVVKWSGKLLGLVGRSPQERWGNRKREREVRDTPRSFPCWGEGNDIQQCPFHPIVRKHKNEKWRNEEETRNNGWKTWEETEHDTVQHLLCNYQLSNYHYNEEVTVSVVTWTTILIGSFNLMRAITRTDRGGRLASGSRLVFAQLNYKHKSLERARRNMQIYLNTTGWKHRRVRSVPFFLNYF